MAQQYYTASKLLKERRPYVTKKIHTFSCCFGKS